MQIQTRFQPRQSDGDGTDGVPPFAEQARASLDRSLRSLGPAPLDCVLLHLPLPPPLSTQLQGRPRPAERARALAAWRALEACVPGRARRLGISGGGGGTSLLMFERLFGRDAAAGGTEAPGEEGKIRVAPAVVQNPFTRRDAHHARALRRALRARGVAFQAYHVLTGNRGTLAPAPASALASNTAAGDHSNHTHAHDTTTSAITPTAPASHPHPAAGGLGSPNSNPNPNPGPVYELARAAGVGDEAALYALVLGLGPGMAVLDGTTSEARMRRDVRELGVLGAFAAGGEEEEEEEEEEARQGDGKEGPGSVWRRCLRRFRREVVREIED